MVKETEINKLKKKVRNNFNVAVILYMFSMVTAFWNIGIYFIAPNKISFYTTFLSVLPMIALAMYMAMEAWDNRVTHN